MSVGTRQILIAHCPKKVCLICNTTNLHEMQPLDQTRADCTGIHCDITPMNKFPGQSCNSGPEYQHINK